MTSAQKKIAVIGAGPIGSLLSIYLAARGYRVAVYERRADLRTSTTTEGRSINLALSNRGLRALREVGLSRMVRKVSIPMHGRMMHDLEGRNSFLPYGRAGEFINSISRKDLNIVLIAEAERRGVTFFFDHRCTGVDTGKTEATLEYDGRSLSEGADVIIGADGSNSAVRSAFSSDGRFRLSQDYIEHGYKEFHVPAGPGGAFQMERLALHIWPRSSFMMIALPNPDGSFTATLFYLLEGSHSFKSLAAEADVEELLKTNFPDLLYLMPEWRSDYAAVPPSPLVTVRCFPWVMNRTLLIGDAAHAVVPFYGQGMNAGFEDCRMLSELLDRNSDDWEQTLPRFQDIRKPDTDAIAALALDNFIEMRDLVADPAFLLRKKIEARLHELFPRQWVPLYSMVTFHDEMGYARARELGQRQRQIMDRVMARPRIEDNWRSLPFQSIVDQLVNE